VGVGSAGAEETRSTHVNVHVLDVCLHACIRTYTGTYSYLYRYLYHRPNLCEHFLVVPLNIIAVQWDRLRSTGYLNF